MTKKKIIGILLLALFLLTSPLMVTMGAAIGESASENPKEFESIYDTERYSQEEDEATIITQMIADAIMSIPNFVIRVLGLLDVNMLVFQVMPESMDWGIVEEVPFLDMNFTNPEELEFYTFPGEWFQVISAFYRQIESLLPIVILFSLVLMGALSMFKNMTAGIAGAILIKDYMLAVLLATLAFIFGPNLWGFFFDLNFAFVNYFREIAETTSGVPISRFSFLEIFYRGDINTIGGAVLAFIAIFIIGVFNFQYIMRMITLGILILFFPIAAFLSVFPWTRHMLAFWFKEFLSNVFLQTMHAIVLAFFFSLIFSTQTPILVMLVFLFGITSISNILRELITGSSSSSSFSRAGAALGAGTIMSALNYKRLGKIKNQGGEGTGDSPSPDGGGGTPVGGNTGTDVGTSGGGTSTPHGATSAKEKTSPTGSLAPGSGIASTLTNKLSSGARTLTKGAGQGAMMLAGASTGSMIGGALTGNAGAGAAAGALAGYKGAQGATKFKGKAISAGQNLFNDGKTMFSNVFASQQDSPNNAQIYETQTSPSFPALSPGFMAQTAGELPPGDIPNPAATLPPIAGEGATEMQYRRDGLAPPAPPKPPFDTDNENDGYIPMGGHSFIPMGDGINREMDGSNIPPHKVNTTQGFNSQPKTQPNNPQQNSTSKSSGSNSIKGSGSGPIPSPRQSNQNNSNVTGGKGNNSAPRPQQKGVNHNTSNTAKTNQGTSYQTTPSQTTHNNNYEPRVELEIDGQAKQIEIIQKDRENNAWANKEMEKLKGVTNDRPVNIYQNQDWK